MSDDQPIFEIKTGNPANPETVKEYKIYTDGRTEGFDDVFYSSNHHFAIVNQLLAQITKLGRAENRERCKNCKHLFLVDSSPQWFCSFETMLRDVEFIEKCEHRE